MAKIASIGGKIIQAAGKIGLYPGCCCESCCCLDFSGVNFTFTIDCGNGNETFTGTLDNGGNGVDVETGTWSLSVICTPIACDETEFCDFLGGTTSCVGFIVAIMGACGFNGIHVCPGTADNFTYGQCNNAPKANLTINLFTCVGGVPTSKGSITFSSP